MHNVTVEALAMILENNPRVVIVAPDELSGWFASFDRYANATGGDQTQWLQLHRAGALTIDRKTGTQTTHIPLAPACVRGTIQPAVLGRALTCDRYESGLSARLLMAHPPEALKRWTDAEVPIRVTDRATDLYRKLCSLDHRVDENGNRILIDVGLSPDVRAAWTAFYDEHAERQFENDNDDVSAALAKLDSFVRTQNRWKNRPGRYRQRG